MKKILFTLLITLMLPMLAKADQLAYMSKEEAIRATNFLKNQSSIILWCACCDGEQKMLVNLQKVNYEYTEYEDFYQVVIEGINNKKQIIIEKLDLAYVHINKNGIAVCLGSELEMDCDPCTEPFAYFADNQSKVTSNLYSDKLKKEIENGIFVNFPNNPIYKTVQNASTYSSKTENSLMMVIIQRNFIPDYANYLIAEKKWSEKERKKVVNTFLDNAVKGKLDYTQNYRNVTEIKIGKYNGRKLSYSAINPTTGKRGERHSIILLVRDKLINFECWQLNSDSTFFTEKNNFLNSIKVK